MPHASLVYARVFYSTKIRQEIGIVGYAGRMVTHNAIDCDKDANRWIDGRSGFANPDDL